MDNGFNQEDFFENLNSTLLVKRDYQNMQYDYEWLERIEEALPYIDNILIVNKKYSIPKTFKADNTKALEALEKLKAGAKEAGYNMPTVSGYRSYDTQASLYQNWISKRGVDGADRISARPGHSEHQTGLGFDVGQCCSTAYGTTPAGIWLKENAHKYGFIIRYPEFKEGITGYGYEPWHIRYLGVDIATEIYEKKITLEEYLGVYDINS